METRSSAQGNCSAKSLAGNVIDSSLSSLSSKGGGSRGVWWGSGVWQGEGGWGLGEGRGWGGGGGVGGWGRGQGIFHPPCHVLHYHMVLRPEGTPHNNTTPFAKSSVLPASQKAPGGPRTARGFPDPLDLTVSPRGRDVTWTREVATAPGDSSSGGREEGRLCRGVAPADPGGPRAGGREGHDSMQTYTMCSCVLASRQKFRVQGSVASGKFFWVAQLGWSGVSRLGNFFAVSWSGWGGLGFPLRNCWIGSSVGGR